MKAAKDVYNHPETLGLKLMFKQFQKVAIAAGNKEEAANIQRGIDVLNGKK